MRAARERRARKRPEVLDNGVEVGGLVSRSGRMVSLDASRTPAAAEDPADDAPDRFTGAFDRIW